MRIAIASLIALCLLMPGLGLAGALSVPSMPDTSHTNDEDGGQFVIPKWRLAVRTYGSDGGNPAIGIYRRMGSRHEFGLAVDGDLDFRDNERVSTYQDTTSITGDYIGTDRAAFDITIYGELRRWNRISDGLMWYVGPRLSFEYGYSDSKEGYTHGSKYRYGSWDYTLGLALSAGADLMLLKHLSLSFGFIPIRLTHIWTKSKSEYTYPNQEDGVSKHSSTVYRVQTFTVDLHPYATAYLCLTF